MSDTQLLVGVGWLGWREGNKSDTQPKLGGG